MIILLAISDDGQNIVCRIYDSYHRRMLLTATRILGTAASEDAVHDVFVKIIEKFENNFEELGDKPSQYFVILVRNHSLNLLNKDRIDFIPFDDDMEKYDNIFQSTETPEDVLFKKDAREQLISLLRLLNPDTRRILENKYILGYSNKEIADMMGMTQTAVSTRVDKAKKKLYAMYIEAEAQE